MSAGAVRIGKKMLSVDHYHPDPHQDTRQSQAEGDQQDQAEPYVAERDGTEQQDQGGRAGDQAAASSQRNQTA